MDYLLTQFASAEAAKPSLFESIGIDWKLLVLQTIGFLILLWFLHRFVYPPIVRMLDKREADIAEAAKAADEARAQAADSQSKTEELLKEARKEASAIVSTAKQEASELSHASDKRAKERAERIVAEAKVEMQREVESAKKQLGNELIDLVAAATEKVTSNVVDGEANRKIIAKNIEEAR